MGTVQVLIDANIYLDLYSSKDLRELLTTLPTIEGLFVSAQIVDEVARRRVGVTAEAFKPAMESTKAALPIPEAALLEFSEEVTREIEKFTGAAQALRSKLALSVTETLRKVADATDPVSDALAKIFRDAATPTEAELSRARLRRERGSPPGKFGNPLGDQLTWEQFLSRCHGAHYIFVVSRDADFLERWNGELFLNPVLRDDLRSVAPAAAVEVFSNLATAIPELRKAIGAAVSVPPPETLKRARRAEEEVAARYALSALEGVMGSRLNSGGQLLEHLHSLGLAGRALEQFSAANPLGSMNLASRALEQLNGSFGSLSAASRSLEQLANPFASMNLASRALEQLNVAGAFGTLSAASRSLEQLNAAGRPFGTPNSRSKTFDPAVDEPSAVPSGHPADPGTRPAGADSRQGAAAAPAQDASIQEEADKQDGSGHSRC